MSWNGLLIHASVGRRVALRRFAPSAPDEVDKQYPRCLPLTVSSVRQQDICSRNLTLRPIDDQWVLLVDNVRSALLSVSESHVAWHRR